MAGCEIIKDAGRCENLTLTFVFPVAWLLVDEAASQNRQVCAGNSVCFSGIKTVLFALNPILFF